MVKKMLLAGAGLVLLLGLFFGRSHVSTTVGMVRETVKESMPVDFEIKRAREMIKELEPEIRRNMHLIAKEEVEVTHLREHLTTAEEQLAQAKADILRLKGDLERGESYYVYVGRSYTANQVENDLANRWDRFKVKEATVENLHKVLEAREARLTAAQEKLKTMLAAREQLLVDVENLEARLTMLEVAQASSNINLDDSHLARTKELIQDIGTRIDVAERMVNADVELPGQIQLDEPQQEDVLEEITRHFGQEDEAAAIVQLR